MTDTQTLIGAFYVELDAIETALRKLSPHDQSQIDQLARARERLCEKLASALYALEDDALREGWPRRYIGPAGRTVELRWKVDGPLRQKWRADAAEWMKSHGIEWSGDLPSLRANVEGALKLEERSLPKHCFGVARLTVTAGPKPKEVGPNNLATRFRELTSQ